MRILTCAIALLALAGCGAPTYNTVNQSATVLRAQDKAARPTKVEIAQATVLVTEKLIPPGQAKFAVKDLRFQRTAVPHLFRFEGTKTENTRHAERHLYSVSGHVNLQTGVVTVDEVFLQTVPMRS